MSSLEHKRQQLLQLALVEGHQALGQEKFEQAREFFRQVLNIEPGQVEAAAGLRQVDEREAQKVVAEGQSALAMADYALAHRFFERALQLKSEDSRAREGWRDTHYREKMEQGQQALKTKNFTQAAAVFRQADQLENLAATQRQAADFYQSIAEGRRALAEDQFTEAKHFIEQALALEPQQAEALAVWDELHLAAGTKAEQSKKWGEALSWYKPVAANNNQADRRFKAIQVQLWQRRIIFGAIGGFISLTIMAQFNHWLPWPKSICETTDTNVVLCTPTSTFTATFTPTSTPTYTPTFTPTPTSTPTSTHTPTLTPTPTSTPTSTPQWPQAGVRYEGVNIYTQPATTSPIIDTIRASDNRLLYICAQAGDFYQVATNQCHLIPPFGWIEIGKMRAPAFQLSPDFITPLPPTATLIPIPTLLPTTPTPGG